MKRLAVTLTFALVISPLRAATAPTSDPQAVAFAAKSIATMTGGGAITDVTLNANVIAISGSDRETGTGTFRAKANMQSRVDLVLSRGTLSEVRNVSSGGAAGAWSRNGGTPNAQAGHNILTDAAWFFPAFSSLAQFSNSNYTFKYVGPEKHNGVNTQHIQVTLVPPIAVPGVRILSTTDYYLDSSTLLPVAISFKTHPDKDMSRDIPVEVLFANYQSVGGILIPVHFQRLLNGSLVLDAKIASPVVNTGVSDSTFILP
jgi:hypothetical protein